MATITLTITKDGTEADPDSGDHATVFFNDDDEQHAAFVLEVIAAVIKTSGWSAGFDVVKGVEKMQDAAAETGQ